MAIKSKRNPSTWSQLPEDILYLIFKRLSRLDHLRLKSICCLWNSVVSLLQTMPWLMFRSDVDIEQNSLQFFNPQDESRCRLKNFIPSGHGESFCVGSSHGWLVVMNNRASPYLLKPFSQDQIQLPDKITFPSVEDVLEGIKGSWIISQRNCRNILKFHYYPSTRDLRENFIQKAVLTSDPSKNDNYGVCAIFGKKRRLALFLNGEQKWISLDGLENGYRDIACCNNNEIYALSLYGLGIEVWHINNLSPAKNIELGTFMDHLYTKSYLVESRGEVLLVNCIGEGKQNNEDDDANENRSILRLCRQVRFEVIQMDFNRGEEVMVKSLEDRALFIGKNHSMSISATDVLGCQENSIYFVDVHCGAAVNAYFVDLCNFNLEEGITKPICSRNWGRIGKRSVFWVDPIPW